MDLREALKGKSLFKGLRMKWHFQGSRQREKEDVFLRVVRFLKSLRIKF